MVDCFKKFHIKKAGETKLEELICIDGDYWYLNGLTIITNIYSYFSILELNG